MLRAIHIDIGGCEGCGVSILRAAPLVRDLVDLRTRYLAHNETEWQEGAFDVALVTGGAARGAPAVAERLEELRGKVKTVVAFGACAACGGILRFCTTDRRTFQPVGAVIEVDYGIPGCPPPPRMVVSFFKHLGAGNEKRLSVFRSFSTVRKLSGFDLIDDVVLNGLCIGCGVCELSCPTRAVKLIERRPQLVVEKCIRCGSCYVRCPRASQILSMGVKHAAT